VLVGHGNSYKASSKLWSRKRLDGWNGFKAGAGNRVAGEAGCELCRIDWISARVNAQEEGGGEDVTCSGGIYLNDGGCSDIDSASVSVDGTSARAARHDHQAGQGSKLLNQGLVASDIFDAEDNGIGAR
jgi:hypothetical protein